jgi:hypothetical protein
MGTRTGKEIFYLEPEKTEIVAEDLRFALEHECRYCGQLPVTVLEHLYLCCELAILHYPEDKQLAAYCAVHDMHEAYIKDIPTPLKELLPAYAEIDWLWRKRLHEHFELPWPLTLKLKERVDFIDCRALVLESWMFGFPFLDYFEKKYGEITKLERSVMSDCCRRRGNPELQYRVLLAHIENYLENRDAEDHD